MDRFYKECPGEIEPDPDTEEQQIIQDKGIEHERAFLDRWPHREGGMCDLSGPRRPTGPTLACHAPRRRHHLPGIPGV